MSCFVFFPGAGSVSLTHGFGQFLVFAFLSVSSYFWYLGTWNIRWWWESVIQFSLFWFQPGTCVYLLYKILGPPVVSGNHTGKKLAPVKSQQMSKKGHVRRLCVMIYQNIFAFHHQNNQQEDVPFIFYSQWKTSVCWSTSTDSDLFYSKKCRQRHPEQRWWEQGDAGQHPLQ